MSFRENIDVFERIRHYRGIHPEASRAELNTMVRLDYQKQCLEHDKTIDTKHEATFLKRLERALDKLEERDIEKQRTETKPAKETLELQKMLEGIKEKYLMEKSKTFFEHRYDVNLAEVNLFVARLPDEFKKKLEAIKQNRQQQEPKLTLARPEGKKEVDFLTAQYLAGNLVERLLTDLHTVLYS